MIPRLTASNSSGSCERQTSRRCAAARISRDDGGRVCRETTRRHSGSQVWLMSCSRPGWLATSAWQRRAGLGFHRAALAELVATTQPAQADRIRGSVGLNFGTKALSGVSTWPSTSSSRRRCGSQQWTSSPSTHWSRIRSQVHQPESIYQGDSVLVFDHEAAFSFLLALFPAAARWKVADQQIPDGARLLQKLNRNRLISQGLRLLWAACRTLGWQVSWRMCRRVEQ